MNLGYWISRRLRGAKGIPASTSTGKIIAIVGVALALAVMEISLSVAVGFKNEIRRKVMGFDASITVLPPYNRRTGVCATSMHLSDSLITSIKKSIPGHDIVQTMRREAVLKTDSNFVAIECVAHSVNHSTAFEQEMMKEGYLPQFSLGAQDSIVLSRPAARDMGLKVGDKAYLYFFVDNDVKARRVYVAGLYESNFGEYDKSVVYSSLPMLRSLGDDSLVVSSLDLENIPEDSIAYLSTKLQNDVIEDYRLGNVTWPHAVNNILATGAMFFNWLGLLDTNVVVIFILMLCVAGFTLISSLFIIILDRVQTIGLLRAMGASKSLVTRVFINIAMQLVGYGLILGNIIGIGFILAQRAWHIMPLNPEMYYLSYVPVNLNWFYLALINLGVIFATWLILILPAKMAARIDPASTMRYE